VTDNGFPVGNTCGSDVGMCSTGTLQCKADKNGTECVGAEGPSGADDNCNGLVGSRKKKRRKEREDNLKKKEKKKKRKDK
jgi:hypothetical protein